MPEQVFLALALALAHDEDVAIKVYTGYFKTYKLTATYAGRVKQFDSESPFQPYPERSRI